MKLEVVKFKSDDLEIIEDNGQIFISVKKVCENLGIDASRQYKKIQSEECFEAKLIKIKTQTGLKSAWCIPLEKLNGWLFTINPNKVKPEVKQKLIAYKNECFKVLYNHFIQKATTPPAGCPADQFDSRIAGYKGMLARKNKEIERLRFELIQANEKLKEYEVVQPLRAAVLKEYKKKIETQKHQAIMLEHNILDLAGSYARMREELLGVAESLEYLSKSIKGRIETVDHFIKAIEKALPKSKNVVDSATKHAKNHRQWIESAVKRF